MSANGRRVNVVLATVATTSVVAVTILRPDLLAAVIGYISDAYLGLIPDEFLDEVKLESKELPSEETNSIGDLILALVTSIGITALYVVVMFLSFFGVPILLIGVFILVAHIRHKRKKEKAVRLKPVTRNDRRDSIVSQSRRRRRKRRRQRKRRARR